MTMTYSRFGAVSAGEAPQFANATVNMDLDKLEKAIRESATVVNIPQITPDVEVEVHPTINVDLRPIVDAIREIPIPQIHSAPINIQPATVNVGGPHIVIILPRWPMWIIAAICAANLALGALQFAR
jgi:hypothetical protein